MLPPVGVALGKRVRGALGRRGEEQADLCGHRRDTLRRRSHRHPSVVPGDHRGAQCGLGLDLFNAYSGQEHLDQPLPHRAWLLELVFAGVTVLETAWHPKPALPAAGVRDLLRVALPQGRSPCLLGIERERAEVLLRERPQ